MMHFACLFFYLKHFHSFNKYILKLNNANVKMGLQIWTWVEYYDLTKPHQMFYI